MKFHQLPLAIIFTFLCVSVSAQTSDIIWINDDTKSVNQFDIDLQENTVLIQGTVSNPKHIEIDPKNQKIYWTDPTFGKIVRSNLDGTQVEDVVLLGSPTQFEGLAIDTLNNKVYWRSFFGGTERADLDGANQEFLISNGGNGDIALDPAANKMYWTNQIDLGSADLDGSNVAIIASLENDFRKDLEIDIENQHLYFGDNNGQALFRINTDGTELTTIFAGTEIYRPLGVALDIPNGFIYTFDRGSNTILRTDLDGSNPTTVTDPLDDSGQLIDSDIAILDGIIYSSIPTQIVSIDLDNQEQNTLVSSPIADPKGVSTFLQKARFTDFQKGSILEYDLKSGDLDELIMGLSTPFEIINTENSIYWTGNGGTIPARFFSATNQGANTTIIDDGNDNQRPRDIAIDELNGFIYFSVGDWIENNGQIRRMPITGGSDELIVNSSQANQIAISNSTQELFWNEGGQLFKSNLDGSNVVEIIVPDFFPNDMKIDDAEQKLYWTDGFFRRVNLDGSNPEVIGSTSGNITSFTLFDSTQVAIATQSVNPADSLILVEFFESTGGEDWTNNTNWLAEDINVSSWYGVSVLDGRVVSLDFLSISNNIVGEIPSSLGNLDSLTSLNLSGNRLEGNIPDELSNLSRLQVLNLSFNNTLSGALPASFVNLSSLTFLDITNNSITDIPDLSSLPSLVSLGVGGNNLEFDDLEPNIGIPVFVYDFQNEFTPDSLIYDIQSPFPLTLTPGGSANIYQWLLEGDTIPGETSNTLTIAPGSNGNYKLQVSNSLVPNLVLESGIFRFLDSPPFIENPEEELFTYQIRTGLTEPFRNSAALEDVDGDGLSDVAFAFSNAVRIHLGGNRISSTPTAIYTVESPLQILKITSGNFNDDGLTDIAVSVYDPNDENNTNSIIFIEGSADLTTESLTTQEVSLAGEATDFGLGEFLSPINIVTLGDINDDGFQDLGLSTGNNGTIINVIFGGQSTIGSVRDQVIRNPASTFAHRLFKLGDINEDGIDDFGISNPTTNSYFIYFGENNRTDFTDPDLSIDFNTSSFNESQTFFGWTTSVADVNQDGNEDVLIRPAFARDLQFSTLGTNSVFALYGGVAMDSVIDAAIRLPGNPANAQDISSNGLHDFQNIGDYDGDGFDDLLISVYGQTFDAYLFQSNNLAESNIPGTTLRAPIELQTLGSRNNFFSYQASNASGDFNDNGLREIALGQFSDEGYNIYFYENFVAPGDRFYDSLALVNLYQETGGDNWTSAGNWLEGDLDTWEGIDLTTGRVSTIDLSGRNLTGEIPDQLGNLQFLESADLSGNELDGDLPESISLLTSLQTLNLQNNLITDIFDLNQIGASVIDLDLSENKLDFEDLELVFQLSFLNYDNQKPFPLAVDTVLVPVTQDSTVSIPIAGTDLSYQWVFENENINGATDSIYTVENINRSNMGEYSVSVTSGLITDLTLRSDPLYVLATAIVSTEVRNSADEIIPDLNSGYLLEAIRGTSGFDTLGRAIDNVDGNIVFPPVILNDYLVSVDSDPEKYVATYYSNAFEWEQADTLKLFGDSTIQITMTEVPAERTEEDGQGTVSGTIEQDLGEENGRIDARRRAARRKCGLKKRRTTGRPDQDDSEFQLIAYGETDDQGRFQYDFLPEGTYRFFVEYPGIPLDESSFVQFDIGESGVSDDQFELAVFVTEEGVEVELVLGYTTAFFTDFSIYPNPTSEVLKISYDKILSPKIRMEVVNMDGRAIYTKALEKGNGTEISIDISIYPPGLYFVRFIDERNSGKQPLVYKIIKK